MAVKAHDDDKDKDKDKDKTQGDDVQALRERVARLEGQLQARNAQPAANANPDEPTGPQYKVLNPHWSQFAATGRAYESQLGGPKNVERLLGLGHIAPIDAEAEADVTAPTAE